MSNNYIYDGFGRLRTSSPFTLFDSNHVGVLNTVFDYSGSYTYDASTSMVRLDSSNGSTTIAQSKLVFPYQPGKSLLTLNTFVMSDSETSIERVGYFSESHGIFFEKNYGTYNFVIRDGIGNENRVAQSSWTDRPLSKGSKVLDPTQRQIYWCDMEWLGVGDVRNGFIIDGETITCHTHHHANDGSGTYMKSAKLPVRYEITEYGATTKTMTQICSTVQSEGGYDIISVPRTAGNYIAQTVPSSEEISLVAIRIKPDYVWDRTVVLSSTAIFAAGNATRAIYYKVETGCNAAPDAVWQDMSANANSVMQFTVDTDVSGGRVVSTGFVESRATQDFGSDSLKIQIERNIAGSGDIVALRVGSATGNTLNAAGSIEWYEL